MRYLLYQLYCCLYHMRRAREPVGCDRGMYQRSIADSPLSDCTSITNGKTYSRQERRLQVLGDDRLAGQAQSERTGIFRVRKMDVASSSMNLIGDGEVPIRTVMYVYPI